MNTVHNDLTSDDLMGLSLFHGECPEAVEWVLDDCRVLELEEGEILLRPLQTNKFLYLVFEGSLRIQIEEDGTMPVAHVGPGDCVGELSVLENKHTTAFVITGSAVKLIELEREVLWQLINRSHAVARNMLLMLSKRVRHNSQALNESLELQRLFERNSNIDPLTGLHNRRWLNFTLAQSFSERADNEILSVLMVDIDDFKRYNDSHGHLAGDHAISTVARCINRILRSADSASRFGGEEFVIILPSTSLADAREIAESLRGEVEGTQITLFEGQELPRVTVSIGVGQLEANQTPDMLLHATDLALYRAKRDGRNRIAG